MHYEWEVSYDPVLKEDVLMVDKGDEVIYLTGIEMLEFLEKYGEES